MKKSPKRMIIILFRFISLVWIGHLFSEEIPLEKEEQREALAYLPFEEVHIKEHKFPYYTYFDMDSSEKHLGNVTKEKYEIWTHYRYYGHERDKDLLANAYIRLFSLGQLFSWSSVMDIYNTSETHLGTIEGCWLTLAPAKFEFYNSQHDLLAIGYMDEDKMGITLSTPQEQPIARYHCIFQNLTPTVDQITSHWVLNVSNRDILPASFLLFFGAFLVDHESHFEEAE